MNKFNFVLYLSVVSPGLYNFYTHMLTSYSIFLFLPEILCASTSLPFLKRFIFKLSLAALGLRCCTWVFFGCGEQGLPSVLVSLVAEHGL